MSLRVVFVIAALVILILDAIFCFAVGTVTLQTEVGLLAAGGACLAAAELPLP